MEVVTVIVRTMLLHGHITKIVRRGETTKTSTDLAFQAMDEDIPDRGTVLEMVVVR